MTYHAAGAAADGGLRLTTLDGRYHVIDRIAAGGMGEVFRARDAVLDREVAIKVLHRSLAGDQGFVERFRREARAAASLSHPNIVAVHDWGAVDGIYYMVMEYVRGRAVRDLLNTQGRLEPAQAADALRQTLLALEHAHRQGIVHRDVKPENILVTTDGVVKVADFGLARAYADGRQTQAGTVTGTVQYLAPEQIRGEPADPRSDLYSLGIVGFELLTGRLPFTGETAMAIAYKHLSDRVPRPSAVTPDIPADMDAFVTSATERDRELRPESAAEMRRDLDSIARELPAVRSLRALVADATPVVALPAADAGASDADTTTVTIRAERGKRRRIRRVVGTLLVLAALAAAAWGAWTYLFPHSTAVPTFANTSVEEARGDLEDAGFVVRIARGQYSLKVPEGDVLAVQPGPGTSLDQGAMVTLTPSLGPRPLPVPSLQGETVEAAKQALLDASFRVGDIRRDPNEDVPEGRVIDTKPGSGGTAPEQSRIALIVSTGPPPRPVAAVVGKDLADARSALVAQGFSVTVVQRFSDRVPMGQVISQDPGANVERPYGSEVTLTVSKGPKAFPVSTYIGLSKDAAIAQIRADGLVASVSYVPSGVSGNVVGQSPDPGTTVHAGDTIEIFVA
jgi:beta-lactam-binding protein with PASTA domain/tRNA A-37 threonylcarbamoyl transferase component Bud32